MGVGIVTLLVLFAVIASLLWSDRRQDPSIAVLQGRIESIKIERAGFDTISLQKSGIHWTINEPCPLPVNEKRLQPLLDALAPGTHSYTAAEVDLQAAGLSTPAAVVTMNGTPILLGGTDLSGERRYIQRDNRVEFAPEWVLSLVNGGLSALAALEVFIEPLDKLMVADNSSPNNDGSGRSVAELDQWQSLSAQQIVSWPLAAQGQEQYIATDSITLVAMSGEQTRNMTLHNYPEFSALRDENSRCAYIITQASVPALR